MNLFILLELLIIFQIKHFICDYPLQTQYMLGKGQTKGWFLPLGNHACVHATFSAAIAFYFTDFEVAYEVFLLDFILHFIMDRVKASPKLLGRFKPDSKYFWWSLGFDQMFHHFTHYFLILYILVNIEV